MFNSKQKTLLKEENNLTSANLTAIPTDNKFLRAVYKNSVATKSGNGALKYTTTGSDFVDQFASISIYRDPRGYHEISNDMEKLWNHNPQLTVALTFYIRMITRTVVFPDGTTTDTVQRGQGLKHEGIFRMIWLEVNHPDTFWKNIHLCISIGSWKDIFTMLQYDLIWNGWEHRALNWNKFKSVILSGLENPNTSELVKKYLPQIKARSKCTTLESQADTLIGKWLASTLFENEEKITKYMKYRTLKSEGTAHQWQQLISQKKFLSINFDTIHGRALSQLVSSKFLKNQGLEKKYTNWIMKKPVAKFTGYPYELVGKLIGSNKEFEEYQLDTIDKQFEMLLDTARKDMETNTSFITVVDTSGSMSSNLSGTSHSAYSVAISMAMYFSRLLEGNFKNAWFEFATTCKLNFFKSSSVSRALMKVDNDIIGNTDFLSIANTFSSCRNNYNISESEFPTGILCMSDGEFDRGRNHVSNFNQFKKILKDGGFTKEYIDNFKIVLWDIRNSYYSDNKPKFEDFADTPNLYHISGLDGSVVSFVLGKKDATGNVQQPKNSEELFMAAMDQEVLNMITI